MAAFYSSDDATAYRENANFVYSDENTRPVLELLDAKPGEKILDVGCGSGELTCKIASLVGGEGKVLGADVSSDMISKARALSASQGAASAKIDLNVVDGHDLERWLGEKELSGQFDKVFSSAALHWMKRSPPTVAKGMRAALKTGGVLALEMGGKGNVELIQRLMWDAVRKRGLAPDQLDPWYFPGAESYKKILEEADFKILSAELVPRPTPVPNGLKGWLKTFGGSFLNALPSEQEREAMLQEVEEELLCQVEADRVRHRQTPISKSEGKEGLEGEPDLYARDHFSDAENRSFVARYVRLRVKAVAI